MKKVLCFSIYSLATLYCIAQQNRIAIKLSGTVGFKTLYPSLTLEYGKTKNSLQLQLGGGHLGQDLPPQKDIYFKTIDPPVNYSLGYIKINKVVYNGMIAKLFYSYYADISNNRIIGLNGLHIDAGLRYQRLYKKSLALRYKSNILN